MKGVRNVNSLFYHGCYVVIVLMIIMSRFVIIPLIAQMLLYTFITTYIGSHDSLKQLEIDDKKKKADNITAYDAIMFPIIGSGALLTLYFAYKFLDPYYVNLLLTAYLTLAGVFSLHEVCSNLLTPFFPKIFKANEYVKVVKIPSFIYKDPIIFNTNKGEIIAFVICFLIGLRWIIYKDFIIHNILAVSFCFQAISLIILSNFLIGFLLLSGLFIYDIFWVFGNDVMVTVARSFEAPVKLLFPVSMDPLHFSMLGLGDIIIPGIVMSLCLRFDYYLHKNKIYKGDLQKMFKGISIHESFKKYYFYTISIFYQIGLLITYCMLFYFQHAQPALLYLVPACTLSIIVCSLYKKEFKVMIKYKEITDKNIKLKSNKQNKNSKKEGENEEKTGEATIISEQGHNKSNNKKRIASK